MSAPFADWAETKSPAAVLTHERVWQAWTGTDLYWGGCVDREAIERVMALVATAPRLAVQAVVSDLREQASEAVSHIGELTYSGQNLGATAAAFLDVADWLDARLADGELTALLAVSS